MPSRGTGKATPKSGYKQRQATAVKTSLGDLVRKVNKLLHDDSHTELNDRAATTRSTASKLKTRVYRKELQGRQLAFQTGREVRIPN